MPWRIRQAGYPDLEEAALAKANSWVESLVELLPTGVLQRQLDPERISHTVAAWGEVLDGGGYIWVVVSDQGEIMGVAHAGIGRDADAPTPLELSVIYLRKPAQGSGVADALLQMAIGDAPAYLWVLSGNSRAHSFYRRHGFAPEGSTRWVEGLGTAKERWVRA
ncbi:MAG: GNAT family N-acetyltransferase [Propionibacteriaceae bacterium]